MNAAPAVNIHNLRFQYSSQTAPIFNGLNLEIAAGERFGLFGPNGAGKTTLMSLMTGLQHFQEGSIELSGYPVRTSNKNINRLFGFVPQELSLYEELTPIENLDFFGAWAGLSPSATRSRGRELLRIMNLETVKHRPVAEFSGGMKRKLNLAIGVIHQPSILFLDEPTVGVDIQTRIDIINYLKELNRRGTTLVYTSHQLEEAESLCETVALIDKGNIVAHDRLDKLLRDHQEEGLERLFLHLTGNQFNLS